jgi:hypothetical protein
MTDSRDQFSSLPKLGGRSVSDSWERAEKQLDVASPPKRDPRYGYSLRDRRPVRTLYDVDGVNRQGVV